MNKDLQNKLGHATALQSEKQTVNQKRFSLKERAIAISGQQRKINGEVIEQAMLEFLDKMKVNYNKSAYIEGCYSDVFTKHVSRNTSRLFGLNAEHEMMIKAFLNARRNLNECFVNSLLENDNREQEKVLHRGTLKNLNIQ